MQFSFVSERTRVECVGIHQSYHDNDSNCSYLPTPTYSNTVGRNRGGPEQPSLVFPAVFAQKTINTSAKRPPIIILHELCSLRMRTKWAGKSNSFAHLSEAPLAALQPRFLLLLREHSLACTVYHLLRQRRCNDVNENEHHVVSRLLAQTLRVFMRLIIIHSEISSDVKYDL